MSQLGRVLEKQTVQGAKDERTWTRYRLFLSASGMLIFLGSIGWVLWQLWTAWQTAVWRDFYVSALVPLGMASATQISVRTLIRYNGDARAEAGITALRYAAAAGDENLAPQVNEQPELLSAAEMPVGPVTYGPFGSSDIDLSTLFVIGAGLLSLVGALLIAIGVEMALTLTTTNIDPRAPFRHDPPALAWTLAASFLSFGSVSVGSAVALAWRARRRRRGLRLVADEWGVSSDCVSTGHGGVGIAWHEVRSFFQIWVSDSSVTRAHWLYAVDTGERVVTWALEDNEHPTIQESHNKLEDLIVTRTGLPLRDLSEQAARLTQTKRGHTFESVMTDAVNTNTTSQIARAFNQALARHIWSRKVVALLIAPLLLVGLLYGGGWGLQRFQAWRYREIADRIHAERPLFHDPLDVDDHQWPVQPATDTEGGFAFVSGSYRIWWNADQTDYEGLQAQTDQTFGNVAVEVTVRQLGVISQWDVIGLVLRDSSAPDAEVVFSIDPTGEWSISRWAGAESGERPDPYAVYGEHSDVIQTGSGATNRLLVLMRGRQYLCFINDHFVGVYYDDLLTVGHMGLYMAGDGRTVGAFTDFTVYPAV